MVSTAAAAKAARRLSFAPRPYPARDEERAVIARGVRIDVDTPFGPVVGRIWGAGPTILLAHGWAGWSGQMTALVDPLLAAGFSVAALDMPAHGASPGRLSSVVHFSAAIASGAKVLGPLHGIVAHSLGASGTMLALARGLQTERVVFFAPPARFDSVWLRLRAGLGLNEAVWERLRNDTESWLGVKFEDIAPAALAQRMETPLLAHHDVDDREIAFEESEELTALWPNARLRRVEGSGHARILRDPDSIDETVRFLL